MRRPPLVPPLRRTAGGGYRAELPPFDGSGNSRRPLVVEVERDGDEWVEMRDRETFDRGTVREVSEWFPTVAAFRERVLDTWVARWVNNGRDNRRTIDPAERRAVEEFVAYVYAAPGVERCHGEERTLDGFGTFRKHDGCCRSTLSVRLPDGVSFASLYRSWAADREEVDAR